MNNFVLEAKNLTKKFDEFCAVDDISFGIKKGEIVGFLGPNGAGKTTTIMMLLGLIKPTKGTIKIFNLDIVKDRQEILKRVNFASAYSFFRARLTVLENLYVFAYLYEIDNAREKINQLLEDFDLMNLKNNLTGNLSSGETTRLSLCKALLNDPELLFLDEPTASLDPDIAKRVRELLFEIRRKRNISMLYTSHNMEEIAQMCDRVIFLNHGKIEVIDTPLNLTKRIKSSFLKITFDAPLEKVKKFLKKKRLNFQIPQPNILEITTQESNVGKILTELAREDVTITDIVIEKPNLEDVFVKFARKSKSNKKRN